MFSGGSQDPNAQPKRDLAWYNHLSSKTTLSPLFYSYLQQFGVRSGWLQFFYRSGLKLTAKSFFLWQTIKIPSYL
jgi:hypothetical protein